MTKTLLLSFVCIVGFSLTACTPKAVSDAQTIIERADSLRAEGRMFGIDEGDSCTLAQTYETLLFWNKFSVPRSQLSNSFAHACYHYGRLLREKNDPVSAMQAFINATHSHTDDYHILGRVYSNIGDICHLDGEFDLSHDMYKKSAEMYLRNADTILFYYGLNNMAFELAEQEKKEETLVLLDSITRNNNDKGVRAKTWETKAVLYFNIKQYDYALQAINLLQRDGFMDIADSSLLAKTYWNLDAIDSSLVYAKKVLESSNAHEQDQYNMLYILIHADSTLSHEEIRSLSAQRSDIETDLLIPLHNQWAIAVQLLKNNLSYNTNLWRIAILTILGIGTILLVYFFYKRHRHQLLSQQIKHLETQKLETQQQQELVIRELQTYTNNRRLQIENNCLTFRQSKHPKEDLQWQDYNQLCKIMNENFFMLANKLESTGVLNEKEIRLCLLVLIDGFKSAQLAQWLYYAESGIRNLKSHTAHKLGTNSKNLRIFLIKLAVGE